MHCETFYNTDPNNGHNIARVIGMRNRELRAGAGIPPPEASLEQLAIRNPWSLGSLKIVQGLMITRSIGISDASFRFSFEEVGRTTVAIQPSIILWQQLPVKNNQQTVKILC